MSSLPSHELLLTLPSGELHKRTEIIRSLTKKVKVLESGQLECQTVLQKTQLQLQEMAQKATHSALLSEDLEVRAASACSVPRPPRTREGGLPGAPASWQGVAG